MYQKSKWFTKFTSYDNWLKFSFWNTARKYFPLFFEKQTGLQLQKNWNDPPINSVSKAYIDKMVDFGFIPEPPIDEKHFSTGISLPLLIDKRQLGGFLIAYKPRKRREFIKWVKYTHPELVGPETPLFAPSERFHSKPDCLLVDNLKDYFKLINWIYCQENPYAEKNKSKKMIIYVDQGEKSIIEKMRRIQLHFRTLTDFSGKFTDEIKTLMNKERGCFHVDCFQYFYENPLSGCNTRIQFEDLNILPQKFISP